MAYFESMGSNGLSKSLLSQIEKIKEIQEEISLQSPENIPSDVKESLGLAIALLEDAWQNVESS